MTPIRSASRLVATPRTTRRARRAASAAAALGALALALTACGGPADDGAAAGDPADVDAALEEGGELLLWAWDPTLEDVVAGFEEEYPNVDIELANVGTGNDHYIALQNAIAAGSGVPDLAQVEYYALGQFSIGGSLADVSAFGADELQDTFTPGPWGAISQGGGIWALPMDSGPMAMFYNAEVFDTLGVEVPTTWDEYVEAARAIHTADPTKYIGADTGDAGYTTSIIWQAGGTPFEVDGTDVTVDLGGDEGAAKFAGVYQEMIDEELLADIPGWSDEWFQAMDDGTIATLVTGAWMPGNMESGAPNAAGKWRVAPMPQWEAGANATAENGGSSLAITEASEKKALAYAFLEYATAGEGVQTRIDGGAFPTTVEDLNSDEFLGYESEYFGGQKINEILSDSAANVVEGWQYLPFQVYANSIYPDTVGQAYTGATPLLDGLTDWQDAMTSYGNDQGFTVSN
ncbi:ABC transporter substrate-binding protein [Antribacter gilvus]|uniref:ABC transporter substrate-binding protein n=1 Tax=Antribacter gilvus TaxID=2304675 RepID=UPI000F79EBC0|nr:sugar ABC transporter substrate-binding protein [Antribacter gilvus]